MLVSLIFAIDQNNAIGHKNTLPWHLPADLKRFKQLTLGHHVIMGRKTYESIGKALPERVNIVISRNPNFVAPPDIVVKPSLAEALDYAKDNCEEEAFVIGGATLFQEAISQADKFYLTRIHHSFPADTYLPPIEDSDWELEENEIFEADEKNKYRYSFITLKRNRKN